MSGCPPGVPAHPLYAVRELRTRVLAGLTMCESLSVLRTRPPVGEEGEKVGDADVAVAAAGSRPAR